MGAALARAFADARQTLQEVDEALGQNLSRLMAEGPEEDLTLTENAQPALMAVSLAVLRVLERQGGLTLPGTCAYVAGHSLGEYSALAAARSIRLDDTARLLKARGQAMQRAVPVGEGAMAALLGIGLEAAVGIAEAAAEGDVCVAANDNAPDQVVLSGSRAAVERAIVLAPERGARRAIPLPVSAPFHCELMAPAAEIMEQALADVAIEHPVVPLIANVTAAPVDGAGSIPGLLVRQITGLVRWRESVLAMKAGGVDTLVELGAGKVLSGLARRIDGDLTGISVADPAGVEALLESGRVSG
jgi:[acyl-carrier-protein] S-malonyltransferase